MSLPGALAAFVGWVAVAGTAFAAPAVLSPQAATVLQLALDAAHRDPTCLPLQQWTEIAIGPEQVAIGPATAPAARVTLRRAWEAPYFAANWADSRLNSADAAAAAACLDRHLRQAVTQDPWQAPATVRVAAAPRADPADPALTWPTAGALAIAAVAWLIALLVAAKLARQ